MVVAVAAAAVVLLVLVLALAKHGKADKNNRDRDKLAMEGRTHACTCANVPCARVPAKARCCRLPADSGFCVVSNKWKPFCGSSGIERKIQLCQPINLSDSTASAIVNSRHAYVTTTSWSEVLRGHTLWSDGNKGCKKRV